MDDPFSCVFGGVGGETLDALCPRQDKCVRLSVGGEGDDGGGDGGEERGPCSKEEQQGRLRQENGGFFLFLFLFLFFFGKLHAAQSWTSTGALRRCQRVPVFDTAPLKCTPCPSDLSAKLHLLERACLPAHNVEHPLPTKVRLADEILAKKFLVVLICRAD